MIEDLPTIAAQIVELIRAHKCEAARRVVHDAQRTAFTAHSRERQRSVHEITLAIAEAKKQRARVLDAFDSLPQAERRFAQVEIETICRELFDADIAQLTTKKRQMSRPG